MSRLPKSPTERASLAPSAESAGAVNKEGGPTVLSFSPARLNQVIWLEVITAAVGSYARTPAVEMEK